MPQSPPVALSGVGLIGLLTAPFLSVMAAFSAILAVPTIKAEFGASNGEMSAIIAGYGLAYAVALIPGGRLGDIFGRRLMFALGLGGFALLSVACALAQSMTTLVACRILQGVVIALAFPQTLSIIRVIVTDDAERGRAFAMFGVALGLAAIAGQLIGGALVAANLFGLGWRSVFLINAPLAVASMAIVLTRTPETRPTPRPGLDVAGALICAAGLGLLLLAVIKGAEGAGSGRMIAMLGIVGMLLAIFWFDQKKKARLGKPALVPIRMFDGNTFGWGVAIALLFHATVVAFPLALTVFLQSGLGFSAWHTGLMGLPTALAFLVISFQVVPRLSKAKPRFVLTIGALLTAFGFACCGAVAFFAAANMPLLTLALVIIGCGQGLFLPPLLNAVLARISPAYAGAASGIVATAQQVGGAFGVAGVNAAYSVAIKTGAALAFSAALAVLIAAAIVVAIILPIFFSSRTAVTEAAPAE
jgi:MFS family permease